MIALDTNVLVYAHRGETEQHEAALAALREAAEGAGPFGIPVFVIGEFLRVVTHRRVFDPPTDASVALSVVEAILASPAARLLTPGERYWEILDDVSREANIRGNGFFDAQIAAVCLERGVSTLVTEDTQFRRFPGLRVRRLG